MKHKYLIFWSLFPLLFFPVLSFSQSTTQPNAAGKPDIESYTNKLRSLNVMECVKEQTGATTRQMNLFRKYYKDTIRGRDDRTFVNLVLHHVIVTDLDVKQYADARIAHYAQLFNKFMEFTKEFPE